MEMKYIKGWRVNIPFICLQIEISDIAKHYVEAEEKRFLNEDSGIYVDVNWRENGNNFMLIITKNKLKSYIRELSDKALIMMTTLHITPFELKESIDYYDFINELLSVLVDINKDIEKGMIYGNGIKTEEVKYG